jgi:hypothetical protein
VPTFISPVLGIPMSVEAIYRWLEQASGGDTGTCGPADRSGVPPETAQYGGKNGSGT